MRQNEMKMSVIPILSHQIRSTTPNLNVCIRIVKNRTSLGRATQSVVVQILDNTCHHLGLGHSTHLWR